MLIVVVSGKRSRRVSAAESSADRGSKKPRFARLEQFVAGKKPRTADAFITNVARKIIDEEFRHYLPLHAFSDEIREQEASSRVVCIGDDDNEKVKLTVKVHERDADYELWSTLSDRLLAALAAMGVPRSIHGIFYRHFHNVRQGRLGLLGPSSVWSAWRTYDILVRCTFNFKDLPDIGIFDEAAFKRIVDEDDDARRKAQVDLNARTERILSAKTASQPGKSSGQASSSNAQASSSRSSKPSQSSSKSSTAKDTSSYECCILCGLQTHTFHKDKAAKQDCVGKPLWLVYDKSDEVYKIPGTNSVACWTFNSKEGCNKRDCRLRGHGHRCSPAARKTTAATSAQNARDPVVAPVESAWAPSASPLESAPHDAHEPRPASPTATIASAITASCVDASAGEHIGLVLEATPTLPLSASVAASPLLPGDDFISLLASPRADDRSAAPDDCATAPLDSVFRIVTPLDHEAWREELLVAGLLDRFAHVPKGICSGFDVGLPRSSIDTYFAESGKRYRIYKNHRTADKYPEIIEKMIKEELAEGRISEFVDPEELYARVGHFRNAPLTVAAKDGDFSKGRVCQDFSYPRDNPMDISFNASLDRSSFACDWGTFAQCYLLAAESPPGTQVAVFDVKAAHRRIPVSPWQQPYTVIMWKGKVAMNYCAQFGEASASFLWGTTADAFRGIFHHRHNTSRTINWADDFTFWRYPNARGLYDITEADIYALADRLGWPWSEKKTLPFSASFPYLGFAWDLRRRTVEVTEKKKSKYIDAIATWVPGAAVRQKDAQSVLGKLVHCAMVLPEGRSRLPALSKFSATYTAGNAHVTHKVPSDVLDDIAWWREALSRSFCGMDIVRVPEPSPLLVYVDASSSFGIGLVIDGQWDYWRLKGNWHDEGRDIGWAEMVAIELGTRALVERGFSDIHIRIWSDNEGVVGALDAGKSRNSHANKVLQRIVSWMVSHSMWLSVKWICSEDNPADAPSRGHPAVGKERHRHSFKIPFALRNWVEKMPLE